MLSCKTIVEFRIRGGIGKLWETSLGYDNPPKDLNRPLYIYVGGGLDMLLDDSQYISRVDMDNHTRAKVDRSS